MSWSWPRKVNIRDMTNAEFEHLLEQVTRSISQELSIGKVFETSLEFENRVREVIQDELRGEKMNVDFSPKKQVFPDIVLGHYGVEVKFTENDTWRSIANSVFEGSRDPSVSEVYIIFGKMGGVPGVSWGKYEDSVVHVRTSHVPRFEVEVLPSGDSGLRKRKSLFEQMNVTYRDFSSLDEEGRMRYVRDYARKRLKPGERFWWLEGSSEPKHSLPVQVKIYTNLEALEKRSLRAEVALLCPQVFRSSRSRGKYNDAVSYMLTYRGVLCHQARDLFSAGSVALRANKIRGGNYLQRAMVDIQDEIITAAKDLEGALFLEYWGVSVPPRMRISKWLELADKEACGWKPSESLEKLKRSRGA